jgi:hypothetical protein
VLEEGIGTQSLVQAAQEAGSGRLDMALARRFHHTSTKASPEWRRGPTQRDRRAPRAASTHGASASEQAPIAAARVRGAACLSQKLNKSSSEGPSRSITITL